MASEKGGKTLADPKEPSLIDKISTQILGKLSPEAANTLDKLQQEGALILDEKKVPAFLKYEPENRSLLNVLRGLIKGKVDGQEIEGLSKITELELKTLVNEISEPKNRNLPDNYVVCPRIFGTASLTSKDLEQLRYFKKDNKESPDLEASLQFLVDYHEKNGCTFSERSWVENLHILLPAKSIAYLNNLRRQGAKISEIFEHLSFEFGSTKTKEEILLSLHELTENSKDDVLTVLDKINQILNSASGRVDSINDLCLNEGRRYIKLHCGGHLSASIECFFQMSPSKSFREYVRIARTHFGSELKRTCKTKAHHIEETQNEIKTQINHLTEAIKEMKKESTMVHQVQSNRGPPQSHKSKVACFNCGIQGHYARDCRKPRKPSGSNYGNVNTNKNIYTNMDCHIHKGSSHTNGNCRIQTNPCNYSPSHQNHKQGDCRRFIQPNQQIPNQTQSTAHQQGAWEDFEVSDEIPEDGLR